MQSITEKITDNIESALKQITLPEYDFTPGAVEQERVVTDKNNRFPYVEISGPSAEVQAYRHTRGDLHKLQYVVSYQDDISDYTLESPPLPKQTASVVANLHRAIMADPTRGKNATITRLLDYGHTVYPDENNVPIFEVYAVFEVEAILNSFDMTISG